jgi:RNA polymerase sporulation-specific sigma factor
MKENDKYGEPKTMNLIKNITHKIKLHLIRKFSKSFVAKITQKTAVYYINGSQTLPPPLTREEEENAFKRLMAKDESARDYIIVHNLRLVVYIAKKFESTGIGVEDLISIGTIGLIKAVNTFSPEKNIKLATYASRCIENEILMFLRKSSQYRNEMSIDEPLNIDWDGNELLLSDILGTDDDIVNRDIENESERNMLLRAVESLGEREREIMQMRFGLLNGGEEMTQKEVADIIGISQSYISRLEKKIIKKLKKELEYL